MIWYGPGQNKMTGPMTRVNGLYHSINCNCINFSAFVPCASSEQWVNLAYVNIEVIRTMLPVTTQSFKDQERQDQLLKNTSLVMYELIAILSWLIMSYQCLCHVLYRALLQNRRLMLSALCVTLWLEVRLWVRQFTQYMWYLTVSENWLLQYWQTYIITM